MKKVAVVILNWNGRHYLERFLPTVLASTYQNLDIYIADNASTDDSVLWLQQFMHNRAKQAGDRLTTEHGLFLLQNDDNYGFAQGYNEALQHVAADYFVLLNSDVRVAPNWLEPIIALLDSDAQIAACQPKILSYDEPQQLEHAGGAGGYIDQFGYPFCRGRVLNICETDTGQYDEVAEVAWASGTALFIRSEIYRQLNGFDNSFFAHMEEIDLCWRIRRLGYKVMACPQSVVWHVGGGTLQKSNPFKTYLNFRNNWAMLLKNLPIGRFLLVAQLRFWLDIVALLTFSIKGEWGNARALLKAHRHFWSRLGQFWDARRTAQNNIAQYQQLPDRSQLSGYYKGSIIFDFFVRQKKTFKAIMEG
jgi:GT2 family glycosyltransferase